MIQSEKSMQEFLEQHLAFIHESRTFSLKIASLYQLPQHFMEVNAAQIDYYVREHAVPGSPTNRNSAVKGMKDLLAGLDDLKQQILDLFAEHRNLIDSSTTYLEKVKHGETGLIAEVSGLRLRVTDLNEKTISMLNLLKWVEEKWQGIHNKTMA